MLYEVEEAKFQQASKDKEAFFMLVLSSISPSARRYIFTKVDLKVLQRESWQSQTNEKMINVRFIESIKTIPYMSIKHFY